MNAVWLISLFLVMSYLSNRSWCRQLDELVAAERQVCMEQAEEIRTLREAQRRLCAAPPAGPYREPAPGTDDMLILDNSDGPAATDAVVTCHMGGLDPNTGVSAPMGSVYHRSNGSVYVNTDGATAWAMVVGRR